MAYRDPPTTFWVWRFMIDAAHQGKGYGRRALELLVDEARKDGVDEVKLSYHPGEHSPHEFYTRFGFVDTGEFEQGEVVMRLALDPPAQRMARGYVFAAMRAVTTRKLETTRKSSQSQPPAETPRRSSRMPCTS
jgi:RimJ/RimL family protein N-acetyltransferase